MIILSRKQDKNRRKMPSSDTQFKKGQSGNPGGRPKSYFGKILAEIGEEIEPKTGKPFKQLVSRRLWVDAVNGNINAIKEIINRLDGLPQAFTELSTRDGKPLIQINYGHRQSDKPTAKAKGSS